MQNEIHEDTIIRNYIILIKYERREIQKGKTKNLQQNKHSLIKSIKFLIKS